MAGLQVLFERFGGVRQAVHGGCIGFGAGLQFVPGRCQLTLFGFGLIGCTLRLLQRGLQGGSAFLAQGLNFGFQTIDVDTGLFGHATCSLQQLLRHRRQTRYFSIHLGQCLLQSFIEPGILCFYGSQGTAYHNFSMLQRDLCLGLGLGQHFIQRRTPFIQCCVDLDQCLVQ